MKSLRLLWVTLPTMAIVFCLCGLATAQVTYDVANYKALAELGKVIKTMFLCRYLGTEAFQRKIHQGMNVVDKWEHRERLHLFRARR